MFSDNSTVVRAANKLFDDRLRSLRPDNKGEEVQFTQVLESIRTKLQRTHPYNQAQFKLGGSFKKNTMLKSHREFDIIIVFPTNISGFNPSTGTKDRFRKEIASIYKEKLVNLPEGGHNVKLNINNIDIDILPTFEITFEKFFQLSKEIRDPYKGYLSLKHIAFMFKADRGNLYQDTCRLIKYWAHGPSHQHRQKMSSSWFLELITAYALDHVDLINYCSIFEMTLRMLKNIKKRIDGRYKCITFDDFYSNTKEIKQYYQSELAVVEPTDPLDNLIKKNPQREHLDELIIKAKNTLSLWDVQKFEAVYQQYFARNPF